jgi:hypothetical protein
MVYRMSSMLVYITYTMRDRIKKGRMRSATRGGKTKRKREEKERERERGGGRRESDRQTDRQTDKQVTTKNTYTNSQVDEGQPHRVGW